MSQQRDDCIGEASIASSCTAGFSAARLLTCLAGMQLCAWYKQPLRLNFEFKIVHIQGSVCSEEYCNGSPSKERPR